jgi:PAS domain S-box-containing protein
VIVCGFHLANVFTGQVLFEQPDIEKFRQQALDFGYDVEAYLKALEEVPVIDEKEFKGILAFLAEMAVMLAEQGLLELRSKEHARKLMESENALRESEARYKRLSENVPVIVYQCKVSPDGKVSFFYVSPQVKELIGVSAQDVLQDSSIFFDLIHPDYKEIVDKDIKSYSMHCLPFRQTVLLDCNGHYKWFEIISQSAQDSIDKSIRTGVVVDITEKKKMEERFLQSQKMEAIGLLASGLSHDFNNMLSIIRGYAEILIDEMEEKCLDSRQKVEEMQKAAERASSLTRQLLALSRQQTIFPQKLNINSVINDMLNMLRRLIGENINLSWLPAKNLWTVLMDPSQLNHILVNLCVNSRDAISGTGNITIKTAMVSFDDDLRTADIELAPGEYVLLSVSDDGSGLTPELKHKIFTPFFTTKDPGRGTGLGLSSVQNIVTQNNGFITVQSESGEGTTFKIFLPRIPGKADDMVKQEMEKVSVRGSETVLLVEEEPPLLKMTETILKTQGYRVLSALKPKEAILLAEKHKYEINLLITDVVMPEMDGSELIGRLRYFCPYTKVIYLSGHAFDNVAHHELLNYGRFFLQKPFSKTELLAKIREVLDDGG